MREKGREEAERSSWRAAPDAAPDGAGRHDRRPLSYGEAWLERELLTIRHLADAGYPAATRRPAGGRAGEPAGLVPGRPETPRLDPAVRPPSRRRTSAQVISYGATGRPSDGSPRRPHALPVPAALPGGGDRGAASAPALRGGAARTKPRGLRRLLPGVATLAALAGVWSGAAMLASGPARPLAVLPGSVPTSGGYLYVVRPGDTLWSIASRLEPGRDPRALVAELESQVHGAVLLPGARLKLP